MHSVAAEPGEPELGRASGGQGCPGQPIVIRTLRPWLHERVFAAGDKIKTESSAGRRSTCCAPRPLMCAVTPFQGHPDLASRRPVIILLAPSQTGRFVIDTGKSNELGEQDQLRLTAWTPNVRVDHHQRSGHATPTADRRPPRRRRRGTHPSARNAANPAVLAVRIPLPARPDHP